MNQEMKAKPDCGQKPECEQSVEAARR